MGIEIAEKSKEVRLCESRYVHEPSTSFCLPREPIVT